jgi:hypothetical protein
MEPLAGQADVFANSGSDTAISVSLNERWIGLRVVPGAGGAQVPRQEEFGSKLNV